MAGPKNDKSGAECGAQGDSGPGPCTKVNTMSKEDISEKKIKVSRHTGKKFGTVGISFKHMKSMKSLCHLTAFLKSEFGHMCHIDDHYSIVFYWLAFV